jgi:hypothetical protein
MKNPICFLLLLAAISGCTTNSNSAAKSQAQASWRAQQEDLAQKQQQQPAIFVRGEVKNRIIPWNADLTLAQAIVAAEYHGLWDPHSILIIRKGQTFKVNPKHLLWRVEDPLLEAGDIVEIQR